MSNRLLSLRSMLAFVAGLAALGAIAIQATVGSAAPAPNSRHLVATPVKNAAMFGDKLSGDDTGIDRGVCTFIGGKSLCTIEAKLSKGTLSLQSILPDKLNNTPIAVLGGTGDYDGASGTALVTDVAKNKTDINITFK